MKEYEILVHYGFVDEDGEIDSEQEEYISVFAENEDERVEEAIEDLLEGVWR